MAVPQEKEQGRMAAYSRPYKEMVYHLVSPKW
jgi:hypothetical protein